MWSNTLKHHRVPQNQTRVLPILTCMRRQARNKNMGCSGVIDSIGYRVSMVRVSASCRCERLFCGWSSSRRRSSRPWTRQCRPSLHHRLGVHLGHVRHPFRPYRQTLVRRLGHHPFLPCHQTHRDPLCRLPCLHDLRNHPDPNPDRRNRRLREEGGVESSQDG